MGEIKKKRNEKAGRKERPPFDAIWCQDGQSFSRSFALLLIENGLTLGIRTSAEFRLVISFDRVQTECKLSWMDRIRVTQKRPKIIIIEDEEEKNEMKKQMR